VVLYTSAGGHVILDLFGYITGPTAPITTRGLFVPLPAPYRMLDTRTSNNNPLGATLRMWKDWIVDVNVFGRGGVPTSGVGAIVGNTTFVDSHGPGWLAAYPAGTLFPGTSTVNAYFGGQTVPNHTTSPLSTRGLSIRAGDTGGHVLFDAAGYYLGNPAAANLPASTNIPPPPQFPLLLTIPSIGHQSWIQQDTSDADLARGPGWWPGSAYPGVAGNFVVFGHRTEHGGPFRGINGISVGDIIVVEGDHRKVTYQVTEDWWVITAAEAPNVVGPTDGNHITLIACTKPNGEPTSTSYRIVVRATLISYTNT
jgi:LPXTG-site transpeptidase (sortase) family protein